MKALTIITGIVVGVVGILLIVCELQLNGVRGVEPLTGATTLEIAGQWIVYAVNSLMIIFLAGPSRGVPNYQSRGGAGRQRES